MLKKLPKKSSNPYSRKRKTRHRFRPRIEGLEDRTVPSGGVVKDAVTTAVKIIGEEVIKKQEDLTQGEKDSVNFFLSIAVDVLPSVESFEKQLTSKALKGGAKLALSKTDLPPAAQNGLSAITDAFVDVVFGGLDVQSKATEAPFLIARDIVTTVAPATHGFIENSPVPRELTDAESAAWAAEHLNFNDAGPESIKPKSASQLNTGLLGGEAERFDAVTSVKGPALGRGAQTNKGDIDSTHTNTGSPGTTGSESPGGGESGDNKPGQRPGSGDDSGSSGSGGTGGTSGNNTGGSGGSGSTGNSTPSNNPTTAGTTEENNTSEGGNSGESGSGEDADNHDSFGWYQRNPDGTWSPAPESKSGNGRSEDDPDLLQEYDEEDILNDEEDSDNNNDTDSDDTDSDDTDSDNDDDDTDDSDDDSDSGNDDDGDTGDDDSDSGDTDDSGDSDDSDEDEYTPDDTGYGAPAGSMTIADGLEGGKTFSRQLTNPGPEETEPSEADTAAAATKLEAAGSISVNPDPNDNGTPTKGTPAPIGPVDPGVVDPPGPGGGLAQKERAAAPEAARTASPANSLKSSPFARSMQRKAFTTTTRRSTTYARKTPRMVSGFASKLRRSFSRMRSPWSAFRRF